jgi:nitrite reductase/ring-hydroxylating ferredoxin subunit
LGILGALGAAVAGLMDWMDVDPPEKSVGAVHAMLNVAATLIFTASLVMRWQGQWQLSWTSCVVALAGYLLMTIGATLGGAMVYRMGVMINRNAYRNGPADFQPAIAASKLAEGQMVRVEVDGRPILLVKSGAKICAIGAVCSHYGAPLNEGAIEDGAVRCPWHGSRFALEDGSVREGPTCTPVPSYEVKLVNDQIEVKMRV